MKCDQCGSEWSVPDKLKQTIVKCPFCGAFLNKNENKTITDVLVEWGRKEGLDFFRDSIKINGILADMFPSMGRERNAIKVGLEKGIGAKIIQLHYEDDDGIRSIQISQIERILLEDAWLSESATEFVLSTFITASDIVGGKDIRNYSLEARASQSFESEKIVTNKKKENNSGIVVSEKHIKQEQTAVKQKDLSVQITELLEEGQKLETANKYEDAVKTYLKATILGDTEAAYRIAEIYYEDERTMEESVRWYTLAANQGHSKAQNSLGHLYEQGKGVNKDIKTAFYWFQKAASNGDRNAQNNLALFYEQGLGTSVDYKKAFEWYTKAASQGHPGAQNNLGLLYEFGQGVEENLNQAIKWYKMAADNGSKIGKVNYDRCVIVYLL